MDYNMNRFKGAILLRGAWDLVLFGPDGEIKDARYDEANTVVKAGKVHLADHLATKSVAYPMKYLGIGTDGTATNEDTHTALLAEANHGTNGYARVTGTPSAADNGSGIVKVYQVQGTFAAGNMSTTNTFQEAAVFSGDKNPTAGTMLNRVTFGGIEKTNADSLQITMKITLG